MYLHFLLKMFQVCKFKLANKSKLFISCLWKKQNITIIQSENNCIEMLVLEIDNLDYRNLWNKLIMLFWDYKFKWTLEQPLKNINQFKLLLKIGNSGKV